MSHPNFLNMMEWDDGLSKVEPKNFSWIDPGRLAAFGQPYTQSRLRYIIDVQNIPYLITLSPEAKPPLIGGHGHIPAAPGFKHWELICIQEFEAPSLLHIDQFIRYCEEARSIGQAVGIHCRMGLGRTGVMAACYLIKFHNKTAQAAIAEIREKRPGSIETACQEESVISYYLALCKERQKAESKASLDDENKDE